MDKTQLKDFAVYSRNKLRHDVISRLHLHEITEDGIDKPKTKSKDLIEFKTTRLEGQDNVNKYNNLISRLKLDSEGKEFSLAFDDFVEEVAYTWFNRIIALRFMEVNGYLSHGFRVLSSSEEGVVDPDVLKNYRYLDIGLNEDEIWELDDLSSKADVTSQNKIFQIIFLKQCHALNNSLPDLFEKTQDYKDLLLPLSYTDPQSVIYKLVNEVSESIFDIQSEDGSGQIEVIGWLYQYYNIEKKQKVDSQVRLKKIRKEDIPSITQLFTPKWIVQYMVQNSLGRIWIEHLIAKGDTRCEKEIADSYTWSYYIPNAEQEEVVNQYILKMRKVRKSIRLEELKFLDPAMGSGHILVYAFELFMQIYVSEGYQAREATKLILENNLYGLDIDERAYQLSYFSLMMKAREYNRRILNHKVVLNIYQIKESNNIDRNHYNEVGLSPKEIEELGYILEFFVDAKEYGSILKADYGIDVLNLKSSLINFSLEYQISFATQGLDETVRLCMDLLNQYNVLITKFEVIVTNPPYLGRGYMSQKLSEYTNKNYPYSKNDLSSVFMDVSYNMADTCGYYAMINQHSWMFLKSFEKLRKHLIETQTIMNLVHLGAGAFEDISGEVVQSTAFVIQGHPSPNYKGTYLRLVKKKNKELSYLENINKDDNDVYITSGNKLNLIPGNPIAYWSNDNIIGVFEKGIPMKDFIEPKQGLATTDNKKYLRLWHEVEFSNITMTAKDVNDSVKKKVTWVPYNKGGPRRQWYGNYDYIVFWENNGESIKTNVLRKYPYLKTPDFVVKNTAYYFKESITWNLIASDGFNIRFRESGSIHDVSGMSAFSDSKERLVYAMAILSTKVANYIFKILNPTINLQIGDFNNFPILFKKDIYSVIYPIVKININLSKKDWDSNETSWNYEKDLLIPTKIEGDTTIENSYNYAKKNTCQIFQTIKENEEQLNEIFITKYSLEDKLDPFLSDKDITITKIFDSSEEIYEDIKGNRYMKTKKSIITDFISYSIGCMMGRYSLDEEGLIYAGGAWDSDKYKTYQPAEDNVLIFSEDSSYSGDVVDRFVEFVEVTFGNKHLEENLNFIADSLSKTGASRERIRKYLMNDFYKDHVQKYQKTPIYWMYDSGAGKAKRQQQNSFKALVYIHRYTGDTSGKVRIDYLHEIQRSNEIELRNLERELVHVDTTKEEKIIQSRIFDLRNKLKEIQDYDEKLGRIALERIEIDLDDGVKVNHEKVQTTSEGEVLQILSDIK